MLIERLFMTKKPLIITIVVAIFVVGLGYLIQTIPPESEIIQVEMVSNEGEPMGTIDLVETTAGVMLRLNLKGLGNGEEHAIHIHEKGKCTPAGSFTDAGGHFNPRENKHGMQHPEGQHAGDMPNLKPDEEGVLKTQFLNKFITLNEDDQGERASVFDADGSSIIIHEGADDHMSQPSGDAGARLACGVISKKTEQ